MDQLHTPSVAIRFLLAVVEGLWWVFPLWLRASVTLRVSWVGFDLALGKEFTVALTLDELIEFFTQAGADDPEGWARSEFDEGINQRGRYIFLRQAWEHVIADGSTSWIDSSIAATHRSPDDPYAGEGAALERLLAAGASREDLSELVRNVQAEFLGSICYLLEDPGVLPEVAKDFSWGLFMTDDDGNPLVPLMDISGLHESVLETDPTGREMRPLSR